MYDQKLPEDLDLFCVLAGKQEVAVIQCNL